MEQNKKPKQSLLDSIKENDALFEKLHSKAKEKNQEVNLVDLCIIAMQSDEIRLAEKDSGTHEISDTYYIKYNRSFLEPVEITPKGICIYASGVVINAMNLIQNIYNLYYANEDENTSVHAIINYEDGKIYQTLPWNYRGAHQNSEIDNTFIGIVICEANASSLHNDPMADTFNSLVALVAWLCNTYDILLNEESFRLNQGTGQVKDIASYWQGIYSNEEFLSKVKEKMESGITAKELKDIYYAQ